MSKLTSIFSKTGELSSKRVFGGLGVLVILVCYTLAAINHTELPSVTEFMFTGFVTLLGCDSVIGAFTKKTEEKGTDL